MLRQLNSHELSLCLRGGELFFKEASLPGEFKPGVFIEKISHLIDIGVAAVIGSFGDDGKIQGAIAFSVYDDIYTGDKTATEMWWFVLPEHRGGSIAMRLIRSFERFAANLGCRRVCMIHLEALQSDRLSELYMHLGYSRVESCYSKSLG
jgi:GNAT superfamily N-acetyltransferase